MIHIPQSYLREEFSTSSNRKLSCDTAKSVVVICGTVALFLFYCSNNIFISTIEFLKYCHLSNNQSYFSKVKGHCLQQLEVLFPAERPVYSDATVLLGDGHLFQLMSSRE